MMFSLRAANRAILPVLWRDPECGNTAKKLVNTGCDHTTWTGHSLHLGNHLFNLRENAIAASRAFAASRSKRMMGVCPFSRASFTPM
jgi:hypothetical protein